MQFEIIPAQNKRPKNYLHKYYHKVTKIEIKIPVNPGFEQPRCSNLNQFLKRPLSLIFITLVALKPPSHGPVSYFSLLKIDKTPKDILINHKETRMVKYEED